MSAVSNRKFPYFKLYINNLSNKADKTSLSSYALKSDLDPLFTSRGTLTISADDAGIGCWRINSVNPVNGISDGILLCFSTFNTDHKVNLQFLYESDNSRGKMYMRVCWYGAWRDWVSTAVS